MKNSIYKRLRRNMIGVTLVVSMVPLILLGWTIYVQFADVYVKKIEDQIKYRAEVQSSAVELFLRERTAILSTIVDTLSFDYLKEQQHLRHIFDVINRRTEGLVDIGVIDSHGQHLAYAGPYRLRGLNYAQQPWFGEVMARGKYISDVFMGYRQLPHFIIAVRGSDNGDRWILRATIDSEIFNRIVRTAQTGRSGDAYIINRSGVYQTRPRFAGTILGKTEIDPQIFGPGRTMPEKIKTKGKCLCYAGAWLKDNDWLLIISHEAGVERSGLLTTRNLAVLIIALGCAAIVVTTVWTTHVLVKRLELSDRRMNELNAELIQADKMAALGKMAAGIAHEINNPLSVIGEKAGWMHDLLEEEESQQSENYQEYMHSIDKIEEHVERARKITHNMLGFARRMEHHLDDVDVNHVLSQTIELLDNHARINNINIKKDLQADLPIIASDQSQLQQVFLNLINNAIDAIEKNGLIEVHTARSNGQILIDIKDDGPGIPAEYKNRIFDPFFTTKETGRGTGLGLSISFRIIEKLGGSMTFESGQDQGTTFCLKLPIVVPEKK